MQNYHNFSLFWKRLSNYGQSSRVDHFYNFIELLSLFFHFANRLLYLHLGIYAQQKLFILNEPLGSTKKIYEVEVCANAGC